jgi:hypothetical protein
MDAADALVEALNREHGEDGLCDVEPPAVLGGVVNLEARRESPSFAGVNALVQARERVGAESGGFASDDVHPNDTVGYSWMGDQ